MTEGSKGEDWIFESPDPGTYATERLPGRDEVEKLAAARALGADRPLPPRRPVRPGPARAEGDAPGSDEAQTGAIPVVGASGDYARSGSTPNAEDAPAPAVLTLPARFAALSWWDAVRDITALVTLCTATTVRYVEADLGAWMLIPRIAVAIAVAALIAVHLLRWIPAHPRLRLIRGVRMIGMAPALLAAAMTLLADLVTSLPVLFSPLPDGPPVGIGVGVALLLLGGLLGIEPRSHEGYIPGPRARSGTRTLLLVIAWAAAALLALCLVMAIGRMFTTGWAYSLRVLADAGVSALLLTLVIGSGLRRERSRYVFVIAAVAGLVIGAVADDTLRLQFAAPRSVATGYVYLPLLFAAFAVLVSRSFVRSMHLSFRRADWIVYAVRALEFSTVMHLGALGWNVLAAFAALGGVGPGGWVLHGIDALLAGIFAGLSSLGRKALLERPAVSARATAVVASLVMVVVGFLDVIVNSLATGSGAGLATGGVALSIGVAVALMLTVPAPVRDEYGAPDLVQMFEDFRRRDARTDSVIAGVPEVDQDHATRKSFPSA